jgi:3-oxoacyl-[acyl-carrier-protein] synthase III
MKYARILGTGGYVPEKIISNADLEKTLDTSDQWIMDRTGIRKRHIINENDSTSTVSMAAIAAKDALEASGIDRNKIGLIIVATSTPDQLLPNTASLVQMRLNLSKTECLAFDISSACAGFIYAMSIASKYIQTGSVDYALVIGSESLTRLVDWKDRSTCILFGDGAGAVVLGVDKTPGIYSTHLHVNGEYSDLLGLSGNLYKDNDPCYIKMRGNEVFKIAVTKLGEIVDETLAHNKLDKSAIDWLVPHQANLRIIQATARKLNVPMERVILTIEEHGNTSAASVPLALNVGIRDGRIKRGDLMLLESFGAGLSWGAALVKY